MIKALNAMLGKNIISFECQETPLDGGTIGNVRLVSGEAVTDGNKKITFKMVYKSHEKYNRSGDANSWKREYDLYNSILGKTFSDAFRWPKCYDAKLSEEKFEIWMEYINAPSGLALDLGMLEKAALEIGRWQGKIFADPALTAALKQIKNLGDTGFFQRHLTAWHTGMSYEQFTSDKNRFPKHVKKNVQDYYTENAEHIDFSKSVAYNILRSKLCTLPQHLKQMLIDIDDAQDEIFESIKRLPVVLCQRDYWNTNIFYKDGSIVVIDWDTAGWGYLGEDLAQLIFDDIDITKFSIYVEKLIPAYYKGFLEFADVSEEEVANSKAALRNYMLIIFGYWKAQSHMYDMNNKKKEQAVKELQMVYDFKL